MKGGSLDDKNPYIFPLKHKQKASIEGFDLLISPATIYPRKCEDDDDTGGLLKPEEL